MDILGIGFPELLFIFFIALMVFGPRRLPEIAGKAGKIVRDLRNMSQGFMAEWQREITVATRLEELEQVRKEFEETKQSLQQAQTELTSSTQQIGQTLNTAATTLKSTVSPAPPDLPVEKKSQTSVPADVSQPVEAASPEAASIEEAEPAPEPDKIEKDGNSASPALQPTPAAITPSKGAE